MTVLQSLGYVGIAARNADEWAVFATEFLGMQLGGRGDRGQLSFRMDDRCQRFFVDPEDSAPPLVVAPRLAFGVTRQGRGVRAVGTVVVFVVAFVLVDVDWACILGQTW